MGVVKRGLIIIMFICINIIRIPDVLFISLRRPPYYEAASETIYKAHVSKLNKHVQMAPKMGLEMYPI